jgi:antibiotic biosynthesis monooxygenase (ABM) superfamily enzyme
MGVRGGPDRRGHDSGNKPKLETMLPSELVLIARATVSFLLHYFLVPALHQRSRHVARIVDR